MIVGGEETLQFAGGDVKIGLGPEVEAGGCGCGGDARVGGGVRREWRW